MRDYQIEALNWMIGLHDSGLNGILADEMASLLSGSFCTFSYFVDRDSERPCSLLLCSATSNSSAQSENRILSLYVLFPASICFLIATSGPQVDVGELVSRVCSVVSISECLTIPWLQRRAGYLRQRLKSDQNINVVVTTYEMVIRYYCGMIQH
jgi:SNF2 family DNA or RNA helicase